MFNHWTDWSILFFLFSTVDTLSRKETANSDLYSWLIRSEGVSSIAVDSGTSDLGELDAQANFLINWLSQI